MKMLMENQYEWTLDDTKAIYYRSVKSNRRYIVAFILLGISLLAIGSLLIFYHQNPIAPVAAIIFIAIIGIALGVNYLKLTKRLGSEYNVLLKRFGGKAPTLTVRISEEGIVTKNNDNKGGGIYFEDVIKVYEDKKRFIISANTREIYLVKKDSFTKGSAEEFKELLRKKGLVK